MYIANPIYDVVFKYLMEDAKIAKLLISSIIQMEVKSLQFLPQEFVGDIPSQKGKKKGSLHKERLGLTVYRLDFTAKIKTPEGEKQVIIELQKAKFPTDIMRFRKYLGEQFANKENTQKVKINGRTRKVALPIISIYFLGHRLDKTEASAIKVSRQYIDMITGEIIPVKEAFIESLTLDSHIIQIPFLTDKRRSELEILLSVFDQSTAVDKEHHILNMNEANFPTKFHPIIRKLHQAIESQEMKQKMELEDGIVDELEDMEREIEELEQKNQQIQVEKEKEQEQRLIAEAEKEKEQEQRLIAEAEKAKEQEQRLIAEAEKAKAEEEKNKIADENEQLKQQIADLLKNAKK